MKRCLIGMVATVVFGFSVFLDAADLPPEHEVRRLVIAVDGAISEERWQDASRYLNRLQSIRAEKPDDYHFFRGRVMLEADQLNEAQSALEIYVTEAGAEGQHYGDALRLITRIEEQRRVAPKQANVDTNKVAVIEPAQRIDTESLKSLYLESSVLGALRAHTNSLLDQAAWQPGAVIKDDPEESIRYQVDTVSDGTLLIKKVARDPGNGPRLQTQRLTVFGINPVVSHACVDADNSCWLYDPRDQSRWLRLANRPELAAEAAKTLSELIRNLQKGDA